MYRLAGCNTQDVSYQYFFLGCKIVQTVSTEMAMPVQQKNILLEKIMWNHTFLSGMVMPRWGRPPKLASPLQKFIGLQYNESVLCSLPFFGRLRKSEVPEPTPADQIGSALAPDKERRLQAAPASKLIFLFCALKKLIINTSPFLDHIYLYTLLLSHVRHKNKAFIFYLPIRCSRSRRLRLSAPTNKKLAPEPL